MRKMAETGLLRVPKPVRRPLGSERPKAGRPSIAHPSSWGRNPRTRPARHGHGGPSNLGVILASDVLSYPEPFWILMNFGDPNPRRAQGDFSGATRSSLRSAHHATGDASVSVSNGDRASLLGWNQSLAHR